MLPLVAQEDNSSLGFSFSFINGKATLRAKEQDLGYLTLKHLTLAIPHLSFPVDVLEGIERFKLYRTELVSLGLALPLEALNRYLQQRLFTRLQAAATLHFFGDLELALVTGVTAEGQSFKFWQLKGFYKYGEELVGFSCRLNVRVTAADELTLEGEDLQVSGALPFSKDLLLFYLVEALAVPSLQMSKAQVFTVNPLRTFVATYLPLYGFKIPMSSTTYLQELDYQDATLLLQAAPQGPVLTLVPSIVPKSASLPPDAYLHVLQALAQVKKEALTAPLAALKSCAELALLATTGELKQRQLWLRSEIYLLAFRLAVQLGEHLQVLDYGEKYLASIRDTLADKFLALAEYNEVVVHYHLGESYFHQLRGKPTEAALTQEDRAMLNVAKKHFLASLSLPTVYLVSKYLKLEFVSKLYLAKIAFYEQETEALHNSLLDLEVAAAITPKTPADTLALSTLKLHIASFYAEYLQDLETAVKYYKQVRELDPGNMVAGAALARCSALTSDHQYTEFLYARLVKQDPEESLFKEDPVYLQENLNAWIKAHLAYATFLAKERVQSNCEPFMLLTRALQHDKYQVLLEVELTSFLKDLGKLKEFRAFVQERSLALQEGRSSPFIKALSPAAGLTYLRALLERLDEQTEWSLDPPAAALKSPAGLPELRADPWQLDLAQSLARQMVKEQHLTHAAIYYSLVRLLAPDDPEALNFLTTYRLAKPLMAHNYEKLRSLSSVTPLASLPLALKDYQHPTYKLAIGEVLAAYQRLHELYAPKDLYLEGFYVPLARFAEVNQKIIKIDELLKTAGLEVQGLLKKDFTHLQVLETYSGEQVFLALRLLHLYLSGHLLPAYLEPLELLKQFYELFLALMKDRHVSTALLTSLRSLVRGSDSLLLTEAMQIYRSLRLLEPDILTYLQGKAELYSHYLLTTLGGEQSKIVAAFKLWQESCLRAANVLTLLLTGEVETAVWGLLNLSANEVLQLKRTEYLTRLQHSLAVEDLLKLTLSADFLTIRLFMDDDGQG